MKGYKMPEWKSRATEIAKSYYALLDEKKEIEKDILLGSSGPQDGMPRGGPGNPTEAKAERLMAAKVDVQRKLDAIHGALETLPDEDARKLIRLNLFKHIPMQLINMNQLPIITMKRIRSQFLRELYRRLNKI